MKIGGVDLDDLLAHVTTHRHVHALIDATVTRARRRPGTIRADESTVLDATGAGTVVGFQVPVGMEFALHRLVLEFDGYTVGAPYTSAAGYATIVRGTELQDFISFAAAAGGVPAVYTASDAQAIRYRNGEQVQVAIVAGPAGQTARVKVQGTLQPIASI